jgi:enediyne biosynthesis thioesterase
MKQRSFDLPHVVTFEETHLVGNVYFSHYFSWQGQCRERFLTELAPQALQALSRGDLRLVTAHASCEYFDEFLVCDEICVRLSLNRFIPYGVSLNFDFGLLARAGVRRGFELMARGRQDIKFLRREGAGWVLFEVPDDLMAVFQRYA